MKTKTNQSKQESRKTERWGRRAIPAWSADFQRPHKCLEVYEANISETRRIRAALEPDGFVTLTFRKDEEEICTGLKTEACKTVVMLDPEAVDHLMALLVEIRTKVGGPFLVKG